MKRGIVLELVPKSDFDYAKVVTDYTNGKPVDLSACELKQHDSLIDSFREEFVDYIGKYGLSALLRRQPLSEALVAPGTPSSAVEILLHAFLSGLSVTTELVVVDPYFFATTNDTGYPALIERVIRPVLPSLQRLIIVTLPNQNDPAIAAAIKATLSSAAPQLTVVHKTSRKFHDRFWIDPLSAKGFLCGTSLNGLGRRYALVDFLQPSDAADVISALKTEGIL